MSLNRVLRYFNYAIALLLAAALFAIYWFGLRPLPTVSGELPAPVSRRVEIARNKLGAPFITAQSMEDVLFAQGFAHAQDRLFQMELTRRQAAGELAEIFGQLAVQSDLGMRRLRMRRLAEMHARALSAEDRSLLTAYVRGVNHFIESHRGRYPLEYSLLQMEPAPWSLADSVLVALELFRTLTDSWRGDLLKRELLKSGEKDKVEFLFPVRTGSEPQVGSNAWAVTGRFTQSGKPILASDPHLAHSLPGIWYENSLQSPELHVAGVSIAGLPGVVIGRNERIAWGMTNLQFDVQDLYLERVSRNTGTSVFRDAPAPLRNEVEIVRVRGGGDVTLAVTSTRHGPIVQSDGSTQFALRWTAAEPGLFSFPLIELNQASNWDEFRSALSRWSGPGQNFVYADADGAIGYQAAGKLPIRPNFDGDIPVDGASGDFEWGGFIPFEDLPSAVNPASGRVVTANQNPFPKDYRYRVNGSFAPPYRARQIEALLGGRSGLRTGNMLSIQRDTYSSFSHFLARETARALKDRAAGDEQLALAAEILRDWNGRMEADSPAPLLATLIWDRLREATVKRAAPSGPAIYNSAMATAVGERLLRDKPAGWFDSYDDLLLGAAREALAEGARFQGSDVAGWRWGRAQLLQLAHPLLSRLRGFNGVWGAWMRIGPAPLGGSPTTVSQVNGRVGASMRMAVDWGAPEESFLNLVTGQSAQVLSSHYKDQWDAYYQGARLPFPYSDEGATDVLTLTPP